MLSGKSVLQGDGFIVLLPCAVTVLLAKKSAFQAYGVSLESSPESATGPTCLPRGTSGTSGIRGEGCLWAIGPMDWTFCEMYNYCQCL